MPVKKKDYLLILFIVMGLFLVVYFGMNLSICSQINTKADFFSHINEALDATFRFKYSPIILFKSVVNPTPALKTMGLFAVIYLVAVGWAVVEQQRKAHFKKGIECGSAKWNDDLDKYNKVYSDPPGKKENDGSNNIILTEEIRLNMDTRATRRNNNITVVGGSGSGKSRFFVKPNILQANSNYVITDPSGELLESTGKFLESQGYTIKIFNLVEMAKSNCYNPFDYIRDDLGVVMMIKCLIRNTTPPGQKGGDPFWEKSEEALLQAISFYLIEARPKKDRNFSTVMKLLRCAEVNEQDPSAESELDKMFKEHERQRPNSLAVKQYKIFKMGAGKTLKSILISCSVRLTVFNLEQIAALTRSDDENGVELEKMGDGKRALFVIIPSADSTYNFLVSMMYSQLFETLYFVAETQKAGKRLESPVRFLLDEFANIGEIPEFTKKLATMRKYEISCSIILQNLAQVKTMYKDDWQTILGNCDSFLFLGGQEYETVEYISKELGDATITIKNKSNSLGKNTNTNNSYNQNKRALMTPDELMKLDNNECILLIRGLDPFRGPKCKYENCKNYKYTADADKSKKYKLQVINQVYKSKEEIEIMLEQEKAKAASVKNKKKLPISEPKPVEEAIKNSGVKNADEIAVIQPYIIGEIDKKTESKTPIQVKTEANASNDNNAKVNAKTEVGVNINTKTGEVIPNDSINDTQKNIKPENNSEDNATQEKKPEDAFIEISKEEDDMDEWEV